MKALILTLFLFLPLSLLAQTEWNKYADNPVLEVGPAGSWDDKAVLEPSVIFDGAIYKMWYSGYDGRKSHIGYATSPDGVTWTKADSVNPVLDVSAGGSWDDKHVGSPCVLFDGTIYKMWYNGNDGSTYRIGYATSIDGIAWTKHVGPVLDIGSAGSWDGLTVIYPKVVFSNDEYMMLFSGTDGFIYKLGCARSTDGITWTKEDGHNPVITSTEIWEGNQIGPSSALFIDNVFKMWYIAGNNSNKVRTGYATSNDGLNWNKFEEPVLDVGPTGSWDDKYVWARSVYFDGEKYHLWYDNHKYLTSGAIGYATSTVVGVEKELSIPEKFELSQNYPNPFNPSTVIEYQIPANMKGEMAYVRLIVYDVLGREVSTLVNEQQKAGYYEIEFDASNLTSGIYFYRIKVGSYIDTKKMVLLR